MTSVMPDVARAAAPRSGLRGTMLAAAGVGALLALALALWAHYGTAAFHEMIVAGLAMCF